MQISPLVSSCHNPMSEVKIFFNSKKITKYFFLMVVTAGVLLSFLLFTKIAKANEQIEITSCVELQLIGSDVEHPLNGSYFLNGAGGIIDCSVTSSWNPDEDDGYFGFDPIDNFTGELNGNNNTIIGLFINRPAESNTGLFGIVNNGALIRDVNLEDVDIKGSSRTAALIGKLNDGTYVFSNINLSGIITGSNNTGGLIGESQSSGSVTFEQISIDCEITGREYVGGIAGGLYFDVTLIQINIQGSLSARSSIGGLVGIIYFSGSQQEINVENVTVSAEIISESNNGSLVGGFIGELSITNDNIANISDSSFTGNITATNFSVGGFIGYLYLAKKSELNITDSNVGTVDHNSTISGAGSVGGFIGESYFYSYPSENVMSPLLLSIVNSHVYADVSSMQGVNNFLDIAGGMIGYIQNYAGGGANFNLAISNSSVDGSVTGLDKIGGIIGYLRNDNSIDASSMNGYIYRSFFNGDLAGARRVGGIIGNYEASNTNQIFEFIIKETYSAGTIIGDGDLGGLAGYVYNQSPTPEHVATFSITDSFSTMSVGTIGTAVEHIGGIVGKATGIQIHSVYTTGMIIGENYVGGIAGYLDDETYTETSLTNSFSTSNISANENFGALIGSDATHILYNNNVFDLYRSGLSDCVGNKTLSNNECLGVNPTNNNSEYFVNNKLNSPLSSWNFNAIWKTEAGGFPKLRLGDIGGEESMFTIMASSNSGGSISPSGVVSVESGNNQSFTITPNSGYSRETVLVDGINNVDGVNTGIYTFTSIASNRTISVTFKRNSMSGTSSGGSSVSNQVKNLLAIGNIKLAHDLVQKYPHLFSKETITQSNKIIDTSTNTKCPLGNMSRILRFGSKGEDVRSLQKFLNCTGFMLSETGVGSPGNETTLFSTRTHNALVRFQEHHAIDILKPLNLTRGTGIFGQLSKKKAEVLANSL